MKFNMYFSVLYYITCSVFMFNYNVITLTINKNISVITNRDICINYHNLITQRKFHNQIVKFF